MNTFADDLSTMLFTDVNEIPQEESGNSPDFDELMVRDALQELSAFKSLKKVNPQCDAVETILLASGMNSWNEFQTAHKELLLEYLDEDPRESSSQLPDLSNDVLIRKQKLYERAAKQVTEKRNAIKQWRKQIDAIQEIGQQARMEFMATKGLTYSPELIERNKNALNQFQHARQAYEALLLENPEPGIKQLEQRALAAKAEVCFAEKAVRGEYTHWINTGDPITDAYDYLALMDKRAFKMIYLERDLEKLQEKFAEQRYRGNEFESEGDTIGPETVLERRMQEVNAKILQIMEQVAAFNHGYNIAYKAWVPAYETQVFPEWIPLEELIQKKKTQIGRSKHTSQNRDDIFSTSL